MESLPEHVIKLINEFIPKDKDMKSPTERCLSHLIDYYYDDDFKDTSSCYEIRGYIYMVEKTEPFYKYALRVNNIEYNVLKYNNIRFSDADLYFTRSEKYDYGEIEEDMVNRTLSFTEPLVNVIYDYQDRAGVIKMRRVEGRMLILG